MNFLAPLNSDDWIFVSKELQLFVAVDSSPNRIPKSNHLTAISLQNYKLHYFVIMK